MRADILGSLSDIGVFETGEGALPDPGPIELVKTSGGWRIDRLPNGVFLDWQQFQETYKRNTLYFADPTGKTVVPDPRYVAVSDPDQLATELVTKLIAGPRPEMANTVRNLLGPPLRLRGPVTRADGGKMGVGRGYGGARIDLENLSTTDPHSRQLLAAQIIWTLSRAGINGPYVINADGAALDDRFADGWQTSDVAATDPGAADGAAAGLHALGRRVAGVAGRSTGTAGARTVRRRRPIRPAAAVSRTGQEAASVVTLRPGAPDMASSLWVGPIGGNPLQAMDGRTPVAADLVARRRGVGGRGRQQRGAGHSGRVRTAGPHPRRLHRGDHAVPRAHRRAAAVPRRNPRGDGDRGPGDPGQRRADARRRLRADLPAAAGFRAENTVVSLSWRTGDDIVVSRTDPQHPVSYVNLDGVNSDGPSRNLLMPVGTRRRQPVDGVCRRRPRHPAAVRVGGRERPAMGRGAPADGAGAHTRPAGLNLTLFPLRRQNVASGVCCLQAQPAERFRHDLR